MSEFRFTIQPTDKCNLNCTYCYQKHKGHTDLAFEPVKTLLEKFFEEDNVYFNGFLQPPFDSVILDFIGGEATLNMPLVQQTTDYFVKLCVQYKRWDYLKNFQIWLETNGTTYFNDDVQAFLKKHHQKIDLPITIDGSKSCHDACRKYYNGKGSWEDVAKAVRAYIATYGKAPNSKITISPDNVSSMFDSIKAMHELGYTGCRISCVNEEVWTPESDTIFAEQLEKFYLWEESEGIEFGLWPMSNLEAFEGPIRRGTCGTDGSMITIDCRGDLFLCFRFTEINNFSPDRPVLRLGNAMTGISDEGIKIINEIKEALAKTPCTEGCENCKIGAYCESCPGWMYEHYGVFNGVIKTNCAKNFTAHRLLKEHLARIGKQPTPATAPDNSSTLPTN